jgi:hypothetical protein
VLNKNAIFFFFFYKIRKHKGRTGPFEGGDGISERGRRWGKDVGW